MNRFVLSQRSLDRLQGVHPDLVRIVKKAITITTVDFMVVQGVRSLEEQKKNVASGASQTMNSKHLKQADGYAHAVDLCGYDKGRALWDWKTMRAINTAMQTAAAELGLRVEWGGNWKTLKDGPHYQI